MKTIRHPSAIPFYFAAAVWLIAGLFLPMYRLWHYLIYAALSAGAYFAGKHLFPGTVEEVPIPEAEPDTGDERVNELLRKAREERDTMQKLSAAIRDEQTAKAGQTLGGETDQILKAIEEKPERLSRAKRFFNYYLPTTRKFLEQYQMLELKDVRQDTRRQLTEMLETSAEAFRKQLELLYEEDTVDITAEMQVMEQILNSEGLLQDETDEILKSTGDKE